MKEPSIIRDHGMSVEKKYWHDQVGSNYRMTNLQAALGSQQIIRLDEIIRIRKDIFDAYNYDFDKYNCKSIIHHNMKEILHLGYIQFSLLIMWM